MLSGLPISLAQLRAGNNKVHIIKIKTIFINTKNSKTNEPHIFTLDLTDELNLKIPKKKHGLS